METLLANLSLLYPHLGSFTESREVEKGAMSKNWTLKSANATQYFLKQYRAKFSEAEVKEIHKVKKYFASGGIPAVLPIENKNSETSFVFEQKIYALFPFINGKHIERKDLSPRALESLATMQAKTHLWGSRAPFTIADNFKPWSKEKFYAKSQAVLDEIKKIEHKTDFDLLVEEGLSLKKKLVDQNTKEFSDFNVGPFQLIHGDFLEHNVFFDDEEQITHLFDFEKTEMCPRVQELVRAINLICFESSFEEEDFKKAEIYMQAYQSVFPLDPAILADSLDVYFLKQVHSVWIETEHYLEKNYRADIFYPKTVANLKYSSQFREVMKDKLLNAIK